MDKYSHIYPDVFFAQQTIATMTGMTLNAVRTSIKELGEQGYLEWEQRERTSCRYFITQRGAEFIEQLSYFTIRLLLTPIFRNIYDSVKSLWNGNPRVLKNKDNLNSRFVLGESYFTHENYQLLQTQAPSFYQHIQNDRRNIKNSKKRKDNVYDTVNKINQRLPLTLHGMVCLRKYPIEALDHAFTLIDKVMTTEKPFHYLLKICETYSKENHLFVKRLQYENEKNKLKIPMTDEVYIDEEALEKLRSKNTEAPLSKQYRRGPRGTPEVKQGPRHSDPLPFVMSEEDIINARKEAYQDIHPLFKNHFKAWGDL